MGSATATVEVRDNLDVFSDLSVQGNRITDLETPAGDQDAATKKYVDESGGGSVFYADGSDGQITDSSSKNRGGIIHATTYTLEQGSTVSLNRQYLVIKATESIAINGKIDGKGASKNGGKGGGVEGVQSYQPDDGSAGGPSAFTPVGVSGGYGGTDTVEGLGANNPGGDGGRGGSGDISNPSRIDILRSEPAVLRMLRETDRAIAAGGGGGGNGDPAAGHGSYSGNDGDFPGGEGQGAQYGGIDIESSADGGGGGGLVALMAPEISVSGEIDVSGGDGGGSSGGGAGGGGSGGLIFLHTDTLSEQTPTYNASGGSGGKGFGSKGYKSGDGADGADG